jgi:hyperosmotically inducible protein
MASPAFQRSSPAVREMEARVASVSRRRRFDAYLLFVALALSFAFVTGCASTAKQQGTDEYLDESVVTIKVKAAILNDPELKVLQINVETFKGVVQLSGFVDSRAMINRAVEVTRGVPGVKSVKNDMRLR